MLAGHKAKGLLDIDFFKYLSAVEPSVLLPYLLGCEDIHLGFYRLYMHGSAHTRVHVHE
jgi:hypothetical protein